ncbi:glycoside hydrolase family 2 [Clostridium paraputrificum]|uniref:beta-galactosidase domain 4-containing protein n=1 Tax=Clostridium paraputrificum TaxID=29363 RepID=UPI0006C14F3F|nr:glycoside hydrolase family 2 [Clostridium paraputrificum]
MVLTVSTLLKKDELWAKAGYEVNFGQAVLKGNIKQEKSSETKLKIVHGDVNIGVHGN